MTSVTRGSRAVDDEDAVSWPGIDTMLIAFSEWRRWNIPAHPPPGSGYLLEDSAMMPFSTRIHRFGAVALVALALLLSLLPTQRAFADHTPIPSSVTLVGSLQSELGCPGDWQPECADTHLTAVPGQPEVSRASFTVPVGAYEFKVALNGSWAENYGANGVPGGGDIALTARGGVVTFTYDHRTHLVSDDTPKPLIADSAAQWLRRDLIALDLPSDRAGFSYRLYW